MSYEDALLRAAQKPPHSDSRWKAIRFSSGMRPRDVRQGHRAGFSRAIRTINSRTVLGAGGLPQRDFQRQKSLQALGVLN
jgi:hypothetical protein